MGNIESLDCLAGTAPDALYEELIDERDALEAENKDFEEELIECKNELNVCKKKMKINRERNQEMHALLLKEQQFTQQLQKRIEKLQRRLLSAEQEFQQMHHQPIFQKRDKPLMILAESSIRNIMIPSTPSKEFAINEDNEKLPLFSSEFSELKNDEELLLLPEFQPMTNSNSVDDVRARNVNNIGILKIGCSLSHQRSNTDPLNVLINNETDMNTLIYVESSESELEDEEEDGIEDVLLLSSGKSYQKMHKYRKTIVVDPRHDPDADAKQIYGWINYSQQNSKGYFKVQMAEILTARDSNQRKQIIRSYQQRYRNDLLKDITKKIRKGEALKLIAGLLMTPAEYDALLMANAIKDTDITRLAEIICTRSVKEMKAIEVAYKKKEKFKLRLQMVLVAEKQKKKTMTKVFQEYFKYTRVDTAKPDMIAIAKDIDYLQQLSSKKFEANEKFLLSMILINNNDMHIRILAEQWKIKSGGNTLESLIKHNLSKMNIIASATSKILLTRLRYAIDPDLYFANKLKEYGTKFHHNRREIGEIFVSRFEKNLSGIQVKFAKLKLGDGKSLPEWIELHSNSSKFGFFLCQISQNSIQFSKSNMNSSDHKLGKLL